MKIFRMGIFSQLVASYITYAIALVLSLIIAMVITIAAVTGSMGGTLEGFNPLALAEEPESSSAKAVLNIGGWLEVLDADYKVEAVIGQKQDDTWQYSAPEIYHLLAVDNAGAREGMHPYRGFLEEREEHGRQVFYLVKVPRDALHFDQTIQLSNENTNRGYFFLATGLFLFLFILNSLLMGTFLSRKIKQPLQTLKQGMVALQNDQGATHLHLKHRQNLKKSVMPLT